MSFHPIYLIHSRVRGYTDLLDTTMQGESLETVSADIMSGDFNVNEVVGVYRVAVGEAVEDVTDAVIYQLVERVRAGEQPSEQAKKLMLRDVRGMAA